MGQYCNLDLGKDTQGSAYIFVVDQFHEFELSIRPFGMRDILKRPRELLDRYILRRHRVIRRAIQK
jgi:hypothetical protein